MTCLPFLTICDFPGLIPNTPDDMTAKLQEMFDTAASECKVAWLPAGLYRATTLTMPRGLYVRGAGIGGTVSHKGTVFVQPQGVNASLIKNAPLPASEWQHWGGLESVQLYKEPVVSGGVADTIGHGIELDARVGEDWRPYRMMIANFPEDGIRYRKGGTPVWLTDLHIFRCGGFAINLEKGGGDRAHCTTIERISGDSNGKGLIKLKTFGDLSENVSIKHLKAEALALGKHPCVIELEDCYQIGVDIEHVGGLVNAAANPTADALVHLRGNFTGRVHLRNAYIPGYKSALRDFSAEASAAEQARTFPQVVAGGSFHYPMKYGVVNME